LVVGALGLVQCGNQNEETPTKGNATVICAESVAPIITKEVEKFQEFYPEAHVNLQIATSREAIVKLVNGDVKVVVSARDFNNEEQAIIDKYKLEIGKFRIALDGVAVIVHPTNSLKSLTMNQLSQIFSAQTTVWKKVESTLKATPIQLARFSPNSGTDEFFKSTVLKGKDYAAEAYPCTSSTHIIQFVSSHPNSVGFVALSWLTPGSRENETRVKVLELRQEDSTGVAREFYYPYQAHIYRHFRDGGYYPLSRAVYVFSKEGLFKVEAGFTTFVMGNDGQRIILNAGLVPGNPQQPIKLSSRGNE
jgi:phosphate transport system substrate-binding protein